MARILCIDYGSKRVGIAVTDPLQIIASPLTTIRSDEFFAFLQQYLAAEPVERILMGFPLNLDDSPTHAMPLVENAIKGIQRRFPHIPVEKIDERYSSKMASSAMIEMGMKKKKRQEKGQLDQMAAAILLQEWMANR